VASDGALDPDASGDGQHRRATVAPAAELDMLTGPQLVAEVDALVAGGCTAVEVTLADVTFIDSSGLHALVTLKNRYSGPPAEVRVVGASHRVRRIFEIAALSSFLD
jgi:anti-sigma B factor antagonist